MPEKGEVSLLATSSIFLRTPPSLARFSELPNAASVAVVVASRCDFFLLVRGGLAGLVQREDKERDERR